MRILDVDPRTGLFHGGAHSRVRGLLRHLGERHEVRRFAQPRLHDLRTPELGRGEWVFRNPAAAAFVEIGERMWPSAPILSGAALRLARPAKLHELLEWAQVTLVEFPWQLPHCAALDPPGPLVLSAHNLEAEKFASYAAAAGARATRGAWLRYIERSERAAVERADMIVAVKEADRDGFVERYGADPGRIVVAPNGADTELLAPPDPVRRAAARAALGLGGGAVALYAGSDMPPNRRGLEWVRALAAAAPEVTFLVVGPVGGRPRREGNLVFAGSVDDIRVAFDAADASLCPVAFGGGTKIKLLESLAAGLPTIAFAESLIGLGLRDGEHLLLPRMSLEALLEALRGVVRDRSLAERLGAAGRRFVAEHHEWRASAARVEAALQDLVAGSPSPRPGKRVAVPR